MNTKRVSLDEWGIGVAILTAQRSTCLRRAVGCMLLDADGFILSTGVNGVPSGMSHCNELGGVTSLRSVGFGEKTLTNHELPHACPAAFAESGTNLDGCRAIHAEQNALLRCGDPRMVHTCYCTASPCMTCVKLLLNTSCQRIVFVEEYPHAEARQLWEIMGRDWIQWSNDR